MSIKTIPVQKPDPERIELIHKIINNDIYKSFIEKLSACLDDNCVVLNIGSGGLPIRNAVNLDRVKIEGVNIISDIGLGLPFRKNSIDVIVAFNVLEHLTVAEFHALLKEMQRVCRDGALIKIEVPFFSSESAFSTIDHRLFFAYNTFLRYKYGDWDPTTEKIFEDVQVRLIWQTSRYLAPLNFIISKLVNAHFLIAMGYQNFFCWILPMKAIDVVARIRKEGRD